MAADEVDPPDQNTFRILVTTDNHVGYMERDPIRGMDSFAALEEAFIIAKQQKVDFVLLGGDLFHDNKPSRKTMHMVTSIIRRYCLGDDPVSFEVLSEQTENFKTSFGHVNYEDPHYAVSLPVFSIHGNHDDPSRDGGGAEPLSALDLLSVSNLINYFGKAENTESVEVNPIILRKGSSHLALYGLGNIRDERLNRMWNKKKLKFLKQREEDISGKEYFNVFILHQNRDYGRGKNNCIHESMIPEWMNVVIWGHEHECLITPTESAIGGFYIMQPGSSVATSLIEAEAKRKHVAILEICEDKFCVREIPLRQVRPFIMDDVRLADVETLDRMDHNVEEAITEYLEKKVRDMLEEIRRDNPEPQLYPTETLKIENREQALVRLKVDYTGFPQINAQRFGARFVGHVANPADILLFHKHNVKKATQEGGEGTERRRRGATQLEPMEFHNDDRNTLRVEDLIRDEFERSDRKLQLLNDADLNMALEEFVNKSSTSAIADAVSRLLDNAQEELERDKDVQDPGSIQEKAGVVRDAQRKRAEEEQQQNRANPLMRNLPSRRRDDMDGEEGEEEEMEEDSSTASAAKKKKKAAPAKGRTITDHFSKLTSKATSSRGGGGGGAAAKKRKKVHEESEEEEDDEFVVDPPPSKKRPQRPNTKKSYKDSDEGENVSEEEIDEPSLSEGEDDEVDEPSSEEDDRPKKGRGRGAARGGRGRGRGSRAAGRGEGGRSRGGSKSSAPAKSTTVARPATGGGRSLPWMKTSSQAASSQASNKRKAEVVDIEDDDDDDDEVQVVSSRSGGGSSSSSMRPPAKKITASASSFHDDLDIDTGSLR